MPIVRQRRHRSFVHIERHDEASLEQALKAIADAENQPFAIAECSHHLAEKMLQLNGENLASCDVVAVGEAAGDRHNLILEQEFRIVAQALDVQAIDESAGFFEGELCLAIA